MRVRGYAPATPCWSEYVAADQGAATAFYCGLFGWSADATFTMNGRAVAGLRPGAPGQPSAWLTYIATDDAAATADAVQDAGGGVLMPPTDLGPAGRAALLRDSAGAVFGAWQHGTLAGAELNSEPNTVCWSEVVTRDGTQATEFYGKAFGWVDRQSELAPGLEYTEWVHGSRVVGGLSIMDERYPADVPSHWRTTFEVSDCAETMTRAAALGATILMPPMDVGVGTYAQLLDSLGGTFSIIEVVPELRSW
ncbi:putative enzyme related to lactoylglutathione lyase [Allocatelliglobosispora scoriae]|uniref:Putative enzyme related to lactoylglutathione lyase n=1 Tax=Allocatelliglobosispora scoriae TaxID=643052 RepID=A0A841BRE4_9ACTN|nr:VOC family protein [Allocatelliglobosispora scoriae]MBB5869968.1 putative enzyme related to lactoylglutathione lyase [Allocatelliglobosispora scoriae]